MSIGLPPSADGLLTLGGFLALLLDPVGVLT